MNPLHFPWMALGRAIGETMIVVMAAEQAVVSLVPIDRVDVVIIRSASPDNRH